MDLAEFLPPLPCSGEEARAALREGMCPHGHGLEPVPPALVDDWGKGRRMGICHTCRPCIEYSWPRDGALAGGGVGWLFSRGHAHYADLPPVH